MGGDRLQLPANPQGCLCGPVDLSEHSHPFITPDFLNSKMLARTLLRRSVATVPARRTLSTSPLLRTEKKEVTTENYGVSRNLEEATGPNTLFGPGTTEKGMQPTSFDIATGIDRLETLGKMEGIDIFDMAPLIQDRKGTPDDPVIIDSFDRHRFVGCTGYPAGSQEVNWLKVEEGKIARDWESGCCYTLNYLGPKEDVHHH